jgi:hypothetical protein
MSTAAVRQDRLLEIASMCGIVSTLSRSRGDTLQATRWFNPRRQLTS